MTFTQKSLVRLDQKLLYLPDSLQEAIRSAWEQHYEELYEPEADETSPLLEEAISNILEAFQGKIDFFNHIHYVWMALLLAIAVEPTIQYYQPNNSTSERVIFHLEYWLREKTSGMSRKKDAYWNKERNNLLHSIEESRFVTEKEIASWQTLSEAFNVYRNALETLDYSKAVNSLVDSLDDCLEGYAIFPGSKGRRELFEWWLLDVVPASWFLCPPDSLYPIEQPNDWQEIQEQRLERLKSTSRCVRNMIHPSMVSWNYSPQ